MATPNKIGIDPKMWQCWVFGQFIYAKIVVDNLESYAAKTKLRIRLDKTLQHIANMLVRPPSR